MLDRNSTRNRGDGSVYVVVAGEWSEGQILEGDRGVSEILSSAPRSQIERLVEVGGLKTRT